MISLAVITLVAAIVNGALGYGFSSITVPVALIFLTNRVLNPALVLVEVALNVFVLWVNRRSLSRVWPKLRMIVVGIVPAVMLGSYLLGSISPAWIKFCTYIFLLPLLFVQVLGIRRPINVAGVPGLIFGGGVGLLYSLTTISGPPLALLFNNEGLAKEDFRAALGVVRVFESVMTAAAYFYLGLIGADSIALFPWIVPSVLLGVPLGAYLIRHLDAEIFRRICMSFDVLIVSFGLARVLQELKLLPGPETYLVMAATAALDGFLLVRFFAGRRGLARAGAGARG